MALDLSALSVYVDQLSAGLAKAIVLEATTIKDNLVSVNYGAKGDSYQLNVLKFTPRAKSNDGCSTFVTSGTTTFAAPNIAICPVKFEDNVCINDLHKYFTAHEMKASMNGEDVAPFNEVFMATRAEATAKEMDSMFWRGAVSSPKYATTTGNLALCDGFLQKCYALSASTQTELTRTGLTVANSIGIIDYIITQVVTNTPEIADDYNIYVSPSDFQTILLAYRTANYFNYNTESKGIKEINHPGSIGAKIVRVNGLKGANSGTLIATNKENINLVLSDPADLSYDSWFDKPTDSLNFRMKYRQGTGFFQPELVTYTR